MHDSLEYVSVTDENDIRTLRFEADKRMELGNIRKNFPGLVGSQRPHDSGKQTRARFCGLTTGFHLCGSGIA